MQNLRTLPLYGRLGLVTLSVAALTSAVLFTSVRAQTSASGPRAPRILAPIDNGQLVPLKGNVNPHANAQNDRGPVSASLPMTDMLLVLSRSPEEQAAFDAYVAGEYDSGSPNFHKWLTPAEIGQRFGPAESDIAALTQWLTSQGFAVKSIAPDRMSITFSGSAGQAESAFHTQIHNLMVKGVPHIANMTDPQIPAALAPVVVGVKGLHNFLPHPLHKMGALVRRDPETGKWQRAANAATITSANSAVAQEDSSARLRPQFGINVPANPTQGYSAYLEEDVTPYDFATIYNVLPLWNNNINGSGQTIAIVGTTDICLGQSGSPCNGANDVATYRSAFGLPAGLTPKQVNGNSYPPGVCTSTSSQSYCGIGDLTENSLDVEVSGAVAPGAQIVLVASGFNSQTNPTNDNVYDSSQYIVDKINDSTSPVYGAHVMSVSYGLCELMNGTSSNVAYYDLWQTAAAEGLSVFVATGDSGSPSCDDGYDANGNPYSAQFGLSVSAIASTPYDTAVGGTDFTWCKPTINSSGNEVGCPSSSSAASPYWNSSNNTTTGESAANYIPEKPWNDTCEDPTWAAYLESVASYFGAQGESFGSAGSTPEETCNWVENQWYPIDESYAQQGYAPLGLAFFVDTDGGSGGASNCVVNNADTVSGNTVPTCTAGSTSAPNGSGSIPLTNDGWQKPTWQASAESFGVPNDGVRDIPDVSFFAGVELQSATVICVSISGSCVTSVTANETTEPTAQEIGGTSVASPEMAGVMALIDEKAGSPQGLANPGLYKLGGMQTWSECSAASVKNSSQCYFQDVVSGTNAMPCSLGIAGDEGGFVDGQDDPQATYTGLKSPNCTAINSGDASGIGTLVSSGTTPAYNAVTGYDLATGLGSLNVANVVNAAGIWEKLGTNAATLAVTLSPTGTITYSTALTVSATVTGADGTPTGSVTVAGGGFNASPTLDSSGKASVTIPAGTLAPGSVTLTVTYSGDTTYASTNTTENLNVSAAVPTVTVSAPPSGNVHNPILVTIAVSGPVGATPPTGTVTLGQMDNGGSYSSTAANLSSGVASITIPANSPLGVGTDTLTADYSGDSNYTHATGAVTIVISGAALLTPTVTVTPGTKTVDSSQSLALSVKVTGTGATPSGTVTLTSPSVTPVPAATLDTSGTAVLTVPAGSLSSGMPTISVSYSGDAVYSTATGSTTAVTVTQSTFTLSAGTPSSTSVTPGNSATVTISGSSSTTDYTGTISFGSANACTLTSQPSGDNTSALPGCSISGSITYQNGSASGSATATVTTIAPTTSALTYPKVNGKGWMGMGGGAVLAFLVFLGIPSRRRSWRAMLGLVVLIAALGSLSACGGGGGGGGTTTIPGTSAGNYTFSVTGTGSDSASTTATTTFTVTVN